MAIPIILDLVVGAVPQYDLTITIPSRGEYTLQWPGTKEADVTIEGLVRWSDIYGDELMPIIMYLETDSEVVPYISLLSNSIHNQDDLLLTDLDPYLLEQVFQTNMENASLCLKTTADIGRINKYIHPAAGSLVMETETEDPIGLEEFLRELVQDIGISCESVTLVAVSYLPISAVNTAALTDEITDNISLTVNLKMDKSGLFLHDSETLTELDGYTLHELDYIDRAMNLTQSIVDLGVTYLLPQTAMALPLVSDDDTTVCLRETAEPENGDVALEQSVFGLDSESILAGDADTIGLTAVSVETVTHSILLPTVHSARLMLGLDYKRFLKEYDDSEIADMDGDTLFDLDGSDDYIHLLKNCGIDNTLVMSGTVDVTTE